MSEERYAILFSSATGNTKELADVIRETLPEETCDYFGGAENQDPTADMLYIGFWTDKGNADQAAIQLLQKLKNKKVFLFGTAGFGGSEAYFRKILERVRQSLDASNTVVGEYMCQGRMPQTVRERYVKMKEQPEPMKNLDALIENFDRALSHPDAEDLDKLKNMIAQS